MPNVTLLVLISSMGRSSRILFHLLTILMYGPTVISSFSVLFLLCPVLSLNFIEFSIVLQVPHVTRTDYQLLDITEDGFVSIAASNVVLLGLVFQYCGCLLSNPKVFQVSLLTDNGDTKDDLRLPTDDALLKQVFTYSKPLLSLIALSLTPWFMLFKSSKIFIILKSFIPHQ